MSSFEFDDQAFKRIAQEALEKVAAEQTAELEQLRQQYTGAPLDAIRPALQQLFARYDGKITEPDLSEWAQRVQDGTRIQLTADDIDWNA